MVKSKNTFKVLFVGLLVALFCILLNNVSYASSKITLTSTVEDVSNPVTNTFTYKIESKTGNKASDLDTPKTFEVKFDKVTPTSDGKAQVTYDVDFGEYNYSENGLYTFIITEIDSSNKEAYPVSDEKYEVSVEVINKNTKNVAVANQALNVKENAKKDMNFNHTPVFTYIYIKNAVRGELASTTEYFKFKVTILGNPGDIYVISGQDEKVEFNDRALYTEDTYTVKDGDDNFAYIYLKANQEARIGVLANGKYQIPVGTQYKLTSVESRKWKTFIDGKEAKGIDYKVAVLNPEENLIDVVNEKEFDVALTGVFINIVPFIVLVVIAIVVIIIKKKFKVDDIEEDEEEQDNK